MPRFSRRHAIAMLVLTSIILSTVHAFAQVGGSFTIWQPVINFGDNLFGLDCADSLNCIVTAWGEGFGVENHFLVSHDGGRSWGATNSDSNALNGSFPIHTFDVAFPERSVALAVADGGYVLRSTDAGESWHAIRVDTTIRGGSVSAWTEPPFLSMSDAAHGLLTTVRGVADSIEGHYFRTDDSGKTWSSLPNAPIPPGWNWSFSRGAVCLGPDRYTVIVADNQRRLLAATVDGGETWTYSSFPNMVDDPYPIDRGRVFNFSLERIDENIAYFSASHLIIDTASLSYLARTDDGGRSWRAVYHGPIGRHFVDIAFRDQWNGLALARGNVLRTTNGGESWAADSVKDAVPFQVFGGSLAWLSERRALFAESSGQLYAWDASVSSTDQIATLLPDESCRLLSSSSDGVELSLTLSRPENVRFLLSNIQGETVAEHDAGRIAEGERRLFIPLETVPTGLYFLQAVIGNDRTMIPLRNVGQ